MADESGPPQKIQIGQARIRSSERFFPSLIMIVVGSFLLIFSDFLYLEILSLWMGIAGVGLIVVGAGVSSLAYLSGGRRATGLTDEHRSSEALLEEITSSQEQRLAEFQKRILEELAHTAQAVLSLSAEDRAEITRSIKEQITQDVASGVIQEIVDRGSTRFSPADISELRTRYKQAKERLSDEVAGLSRRGNVNLVIGGITTISAVSLLAYIVLNADSTNPDLGLLAWHFVPRLSVAVFIEVFSFFFLRLYRNSLEEIKYFQNEITNIDLQMVALEAAVMAKNDEALKNVIGKLASSERNFRLQKGESTVELEKAKIDSQGIKDFLGNLTSILKRNA